MIKKIIFLFMFLFTIISAQQTGYVEYNHKVYRFLEKMETQHILSYYNSSEIPKTRKQIVKHILEINENRNKLNSVDSGILDDLLNEFEFDINGTTKNYSSFFDNGFNSVFSQKEKFLYFSHKKDKGSIFVNAVLNVSSIFENDGELDNNYNAQLVQYGGQVRGTIFNNFGFMMKGTNGTFTGDKQVVLDHTPLKYNYKFSSDPDHQTATDFFDETEGYFMGEFENFIFKIGRDRSLLGYGINKIILGENSPPMDYVQLSFNYDFLDYTFLHGKLLGTVSNSLAKDDVIDKYFVYHRFGLDFGKHLNIGLGEMAIYADRSFDLSYLNPFNFYKSVEHLNQDRDNTFLFVDFENRSIKGLKFYGSLLIDDLDFGKIGNGWYGNKTVLSVGAHSTNLYNIIPLDIKTEYIRVQPYVYAHRFYKNNFTSLNYSLVDPIFPNSDVISIDLNYEFSSRINAGLNYSYTRHGKNIYDENGNLVKNVGGDVLQGHRENDAEHLDFLEGRKETISRIKFNASVEPYKNYLILLEIGLQKIKEEGKILDNAVISQLRFMLRL